MALQRTTCPREFNLFQPCPDVGYSGQFTVSAGLYATMAVLALPEGWCMTVEKAAYPCGCSGDPEYYPVLCDETNCPIGLECAGVIYLDPGNYHALITDEFGNIASLEPEDVFVTVNHHLGQRPRNECK